jgi:uroporphyrinogen III methyltransferase/synthase
MPAGAGTVYLVGAGPGDAGLITLRGVECLEEADVIVYDHLVNESILSHAPAASERIYVGKQAGSHTRTQDEINELLAEKAREGKAVVRLKGGDPFLFGRGGEEAIHLAGQRIPFEVVPGVSSAVAVPAYAGIPVTQRNVNVSLHIVTGHEDPEKDEPDIEWDVLGRCDGTLVFLMGVGNLPHIVEQLRRYGKDPATPVALIRWGTLPEQETLVSTLAGVVAEARRVNFLPPAITVIGPVVDLRSLVGWVERKPLFGVRAALTRPADQGRELAARLRRAGADVLTTPTIRVRPRELSEVVHREFEALPSYDWVVFTSANGVRVFFSMLFEAKRDARALSDARIAAIGEKTAETLLEFGIRADLVPREFAQEGLARAIHVTRGDRVLIPRASAARDVLEQDLTRRGAKVRVLPVYDTVADKDGIAQLKHHLTRGRIHLVTFTSSSTVGSFAEAVKAEDIPRLFSDVTVASIGPVTTAALQKTGIKVDIEATKYTSDGLADAILAHFRKRKKISAP